MPELWGKSYTRADLCQRLGDMHQIADVQPFELSNGNERGTRGVAIRNAAGLSFRVLLERGMGLYDLQFQGIPVSFLSAAGAVHPAYTEQTGLGWLQTWPGGFLTPCGLTQVGNPCVEDGEELGLHGRIASIPAKNVSWGAEWQGDDYILWVEGSLHETATFGHNLLLRRRIWTTLDGPRVWIEDRVENRGFDPAPHMFLQHINLGFPLIDNTARLILPEHTTQPRDDNAAVGLEKCCEFSGPVAGYAEQVFYHDLTPGVDGRVEVSLTNPKANGGQGLGVTLRYAKSQYPILVEWKMMRAGTYVVGLEPANCQVAGRCAERKSDRLQILQPQEIRHYAIEIELFNNAKRGVV